LNSNTLIF
jgi:hypothetical protein